MKLNPKCWKLLSLFQIINPTFSTSTNLDLVEFLKQHLHRSDINFRCHWIKVFSCFLDRFGLNFKGWVWRTKYTTICWNRIVLPFEFSCWLVSWWVSSGCPYSKPRFFTSLWLPSNLYFSIPVQRNKTQFIQIHIQRWKTKYYLYTLNYAKRLNTHSFTS